MEDPQEARSAIADRQEEIAAQPRPRKLADVPEDSSGPEELWRVYLKEWQIVYTCDAKGDEGMAEGKKVVAERYEGRVQPEDMELFTQWSDETPDWPCFVRLRLPCLRGEFRDIEDAKRLVLHLSDPPNLAVKVRRFSQEERRLLDYGVKRLPQ